MDVDMAEPVSPPASTPVGAGANTPVSGGSGVGAGGSAAMVLESNGNKKKKTSRAMTVENPTLDLDAYISNYTGHTKIERLIFIAERCPTLQVDAYKLALAEIKNTLNTTKYITVVNRLNEALNARNMGGQVPVDQAWVETTQKLARAKTEKLEAELRSYKNNLIKESIRMGHNDLGDHYYNCGDLTNALKCYSRTRDYCTTPKHIIDMCLNVIKVSIEVNNFAHVQSYVVKAESTPEMPEKSIVTAKLKCATGLVNLDAGKFKRAARSFLEVGFELGNHFSDIMSPNDVAVYGGLCALASFDRSELKSKVFGNSDFKQFLELEPDIRELLYSFYHSKYANCLELLAKLKNDLLLDLYLHSHVDMIYQNIRKKALVQYFTPFLSVDINRMADVFNTTTAQLEPELAALIMEGLIQARIDSHNKVLRVKKADQRTNIFQKSVGMGKEYLSQTEFMLLRMKLVKSELYVKSDER
ncbi:cop9 signalosome complex subunit [Quaeritorhiza haematococci]|nr:cop9 signalosome complex subunit [Quaeritorhiza haematococci]